MPHTVAGAPTSPHRRRIRRSPCRWEEPSDQQCSRVRAYGCSPGISIRTPTAVVYGLAMATKDSREVVIDATPEQILDVIADVESTPDWSPQYQKAEVLDRFDNGRPKQVKMTVKAAGLTDEQVIEYTWGTPNWLAWSAAEQRSTRTAVTVFDQTSFSKYLVVGRDAEAAMQWLCTADIAVPIGRAVYTGMLNARGTYEADVTVTRTGTGACACTALHAHTIVMPTIASRTGPVMLALPLAVPCSRLRTVPRLRPPRIRNNPATTQGTQSGAVALAGGPGDSQKKERENDALADGGDNAGDHIGRGIRAG